MTLQLKAREMYKPDTTRLAQFWSTFQVIGVTDHGVRTSHWYSVVTPIHELCYVYLGHCTDHQRSTASIQDTWCSLYGSRLPTVAAITGHRWSNLGQATWKHLLLCLLKQNCIITSPAGGCVLAMSCDYRVSQQQFHKYKRILQMTLITIKHI